MLRNKQGVKFLSCYKAKSEYTSILSIKNTSVSFIVFQKKCNKLYWALRRQRELRKLHWSQEQWWNS